MSCPRKREERPLKEWIIRSAKILDIDLIRFTSASPFVRTAEEIKKRGFDWGDDFIKRHTEPHHQLADAKTIIVAAECYLTNALSEVLEGAQFVGRITKHTQYNAYKELKTKLEVLAELINKETAGRYKFVVRSNYKSIAEKEAAARAGLGWYGKNSVIITKEHGSWVVLGVIVTDLELEPDSPLDVSCGFCTHCMDACPTQAITKSYEVIVPRCVQYLSERLCPLTEDVLEKWGDRLYGCSTCQDVCPFNQDVPPKDRVPRFGVVGNSIDLLSILDMDQAAFDKQFGANQVGKRGRDVIIRNAAIALGHVGDRSTIPHLIKALGDSTLSEAVKPYLKWTIDKLSRT